MMNQNRRFTTAAAAAFFCLLTALLLLGDGARIASACSTPVYRYAMYRWEAAPYYVFYFHHGQPAKEDEEVNKLLGELAGADSPANVALQVTDVTDEEQMKLLPGVVKEAQQKHADGTAPLYLVYSSVGAELSAGRLDAKAVRAMVDSPARKQIGKLLQEGNVAAFVLLECPDAEKNRRAEKVIEEVAKLADAGKIFSDLAPGNMGYPDEFLPDPPGEEPASDEKETAEDSNESDSDEATESDEPKEPQESPYKLKIAMLKVSRTDPAEEWLVKQLWQVLKATFDEKDVQELAEEPMVFAVYGRGRAMPPYASEGINVENLCEEVSFLASSCSCQVKDQNPGTDLLMCWNWNAAAEALAVEEEAYLQSQMQYQEFELQEPDDPTQVSTADEPSPDPPGEGASESQAREEVGAEADPSDPAAVSKKPVAASLALRSRKGESPAAEPPDSFASRQVWTFGILAAAGTVFVLAIGFVVLLRGRGG